MDRNSKILYQSAKELGLRVTWLPTVSALKIKLGGRNYYFTRTVTPFNTGGSIYIAKNKHSLNQLLRLAGFPVPKAVLITRKAFHHEPLSILLQDLNFPLVAKPARDTGRGMGVFCNIQNIKVLSEYLEWHFQHYTGIQVEEFHKGLNEFRVLIFKNKVIGVLLRTSASVTGDGKHTIGELIDLANKQRRELGGHLTISPMVVDVEYEHCLEEQHLTLESIPEEGKTIKLCYTVNTGRGGNIYSLGNKIHPENARTLCKVAKTIGLDLVGMDVLCEDINEPFTDGEWLIIETNFNADLTLHEVPNHGIPVRVTKILMKALIYKHPLSYLINLPGSHPLSILSKSMLAIICVLLLSVIMKFF